MSTEPTQSPAAAVEPDPSTDAAPEPAHASTENADAPAPQAASEPAGATEAAAGSPAPDADEGEGDDDGEGEEGTEGATAEGAQTEGGEPKKKKRRRRRKKKPAGEGAEAAAEGAEGAAPADGAAPAARPPKPKREREERERPAFAVGDVVFGKVLEFTEDVLFVDLAGKAKALFDLRELLITEEDEAEPVPPEEPESSPDLAAADAASAGEAPPAEGASEGQTPAVVTSETETLPAIAAAPPVAPAESNPADIGELATDETPTVEVPIAAIAAELKTEDKPREEAPQLPRVILEPGAPFVGVVHNDGGRGGLVVLTHHPKRASRSKPRVAAAFRDKTLIFGIVTGVIKGGVEVDVDGLRAFAPGSHMDLRLGADLHPLVGKRMSFGVTQYAKRGRDVVLSRRSLLEESAKANREEALKSLEIGSTREGVVRTVVTFGAFIDVGGVEGLVPLSEMSHNRADGPKDVFKVGETVEVKVQRIDERGKVWLSRRAALPDPWGGVAAKYAPGTKHTGKVVRLQPFGAFIELESGLDGLLHTADLSIKRIEHPSDLLKVGDSIDVVVSHMDSGHHRISLHPAPTGAQADEAPQKVQLHKQVKVQVVSPEANGLVVRILGVSGRNARGFITSAATGTPRGTELRKLFPVGKELEAKVIEMDPKKSDVRLSIKALAEDNERSAFNAYRAQVKREAKFGTFADLLKKVTKTDEEQK